MMDNELFLHVTSPTSPLSPINSPPILSPAIFSPGAHSIGALTPSTEQRSFLPYVGNGDDDVANFLAPTFTQGDYKPAYWCKIVYVIVGKGDAQIAWPIQGRYILSVPNISRFTVANGNFFFKDYHPNVVKCILFSLIGKGNREEYKLPHSNFWVENSAPSFFVSVYHLAVTLGMSWLADQAIAALEDLSKHSQSVKLLFEAADLTKLIDDQRFVSWIGPKVIEHEAVLVSSWMDSLQASSTLRALVLVLSFTKQLQHKMGKLRAVMDEV